MVDIVCDNEGCSNEGNQMELVEEDSRQEWHEAVYECKTCGSKKRHRTDYDQNGLVINDEIEEVI